MVLFCVFWAKISSFKGGNQCLWIILRHLLPLWRAKKTSMYFENLLMSFESIMDFTKK